MADKSALADDGASMALVMILLQQAAEVAGGKVNSIALSKPAWDALLASMSPDELAKVKHHKELSVVRMNNMNICWMNRASSQGLPKGEGE